MPTTFRLEAPIEERLDALSKRTGRTKSYYLRELIVNGIDDLENYYLTVSATERARKNKEIIPASQTRRTTARITA